MTNTTPETGCHLPQERIASTVSERVVDFLETIEIHHHQGDDRSLLARPPQSRVESIEQQASIGQISQPVVVRLMP